MNSSDMGAVSPIVSVIMPCYNHGQYLDEAIDSVLAQTHQNLEIIVIDDGSTDETTIQVLHHYNKPRVKIIHTENRGPSAARNTGIEHSSGRYILPLDADDRIEATYLEKAVKILEQDPTVGIVYCESEYFGDRVGKWELPEYKFPDILLGNVIFNSSMYRRADWETVGGYNQNMIYSWEDYDFWVSIIELKREVFRIPEVLYYYRQIATSRDHQMNFDKFLASHAQIYRNHLNLYSENIEVVFQHILKQADALTSLGAASQELGLMLEKAQHRQEQTQQQLGHAQHQLEQTQQQLGQTQHQLEQTQQQLGQTQQESAQSQTQIEAMKTSKFWKLRSAWLKIKRSIGLPIEDN